ncbi:hypothetical protein IZ6_04650 [Terrihabitans soli]|uniref:Uncharacterized protein n=1 Tax=Terrihabitans soli TaxID=708113 RepID=A0A6S6QS64_9HYPH|nr:hypothetical protein IZ6_04650 [Terrihabitans soli]
MATDVPPNFITMRAIKGPAGSDWGSTPTQAGGALKKARIHNGGGGGGQIPTSRREESCGEFG